MSEQFEMLVWRANGVDTNGDIVTPTGLATMADSLLPGMDINLNFAFNHSVGKLIQAYVRGDELWATVVITEIEILEAIRGGSINLRPGFSIETSHRNADGHRVITKTGTTNLGLMTSGMELPNARSCTLCACSIPDDDKIEVCGPCLVERQ